MGGEATHTLNPECRKPGLDPQSDAYGLNDEHIPHISFHRAGPLASRVTTQLPVSRSSMTNLTSLFGAIDIYVFDQLLRGRIQPGMSVLDVGCGAGRNLEYMMRAGFDVFGVDADAQAVATVRQRAAELAPELPPENFRVEPAEHLTFADASMDVVICSAVLHFARDDEHFAAMLHGMWRVLVPGGLFFCRLASSIGIESAVRPIEGRRCGLPDGSVRYLVDEAMLMRCTGELGGRLLDPLKTTVVAGQRSMSTWVVRKNG